MSGEPLALRQFREFYREVLRQRARVERGVPPAPGEDGPATPAAIAQELITLLERQRFRAQRSGGDLSAEHGREAQYAMAALADEIFLHHVEWSGREAWQANPLESRLFGTRRAGEQVFQRIEAILRSRDPIHSDLAQVYLGVLGLGFQGRFRGGDLARVDAYRRDLFLFVSAREPELLSGKRPLFPAGYWNILDRGDSQRLPHLRPWLFLGALLLAAWLAGSHVVWKGLVDELRPLIQLIYQHTQGTRGG